MSETKAFPREICISIQHNTIESLTCECASYFSKSTSFFTFVFVVNMDAVKYFKDNSKNENTTKSTLSWHNNFVRWTVATGRPSKIEDMQKKDVNAILEVYFAEAVKPSTLTLLLHVAMCCFYEATFIIHSEETIAIVNYRIF